MSDFKFLKYQPTPGEKYLGIATVKAYDKIVLRYKILPTKDGSAIYPSPAKYKIVENGEDQYITAFTVDSVSDNEELAYMVKKNVSEAISKSSAFTKKQNDDEEMPF